MGGDKGANYLGADDLRIVSLASEQIDASVVDGISRENGTEHTDRVTQIGFDYLDGNDIVRRLRPELPQLRRYILKQWPEANLGYKQSKIRDKIRRTISVPHQTTGD